jgi:electron transfer flavoprotein alpha/beta subunit
LVREVDEDGVDADNNPFLKLSLEEAIQATRDGIDEEHVLVEMRGPEVSDQ